MTPAQEYRLGVRAAAGIIALLVALCVLAVKTKSADKGVGNAENQRKTGLSLPRIHGAAH